MRELPQSPWFIALLCVFLIGERISGAHWHLCFDRAEPPVSMHVGDIDQHDDDLTSSTSHQDVDLKLVDDGLIKNLLSGLDAPMLLTLILCVWLLPRRAQSIPRSHYRVLPFSTILVHCTRHRAHLRSNSHTHHLVIIRA